MEAGLALNESRTKATHRTRSVGQYHDETFHRQCSGPDHLRKFSSSSVAGAVVHSGSVAYVDRDNHHFFFFALSLLSLFFYPCKFVGCFVSDWLVLKLNKHL